MKYICTNKPIEQELLDFIDCYGVSSLLMTIANAVDNGTHEASSVAEEIETLARLPIVEEFKKP